MTTPEKYYRFRKLQAITGVKQITKVKEYKNAPDDVVDKGLCAAMCMRWLARGTVPAKEGEIREVAALQKAYEKKVSGTNSDILGEKFLATQCGFTMDRIPHFPKSTGDQKVAIKYWKGVGTLGTAISKYVNGNLEQVRANELGGLPSPLLPCTISLVIAVPQMDFEGESLLANDHGEFQNLDGQWEKPPYGGSHGVALKRADNGGYHCLDPSAGVYEIGESALTRFFDTLHDCYKNLYDPVAEEGMKIHVDLQLLRIYVLPSESSSQLPGGATGIGGGQPVEPKQARGGKRPAVAVRPNEEFAAFLRKRGVSGDAVLAVLVGFGINSLYELKTAKEDPDILGQLKTKLKDYPIAKRALDKLGVEAIDNAIFYSEREGAEADAEALADFLADHDVVAEGLDRDVLLSLLRSPPSGVVSLEGLRRVIEKGKNDAKLQALTRRIAARSAEAGSNFENITAGMVKAALSGESDAEAGQDLTDFIAKKGLPGRTARELAEFGITSLAQLKIVKEDDAPGGRLEQLRARLADSGILGAKETIDGIKVAEIEEEIAAARSPDAQRAREKRAQLVEAIQQVQQLRERVVKAVDNNFASVQAGVEREYNAVRQRVNDVSAADVAAAISAGEADKQGLIDFLDRAIKNVTATRDILDGVEKKKRPVSEIIEKQQMLCGFLISPAEATRMYSDELVKLPRNPESMLKDSERAYSETFFEYKRSETNSFAASVAQQASTTLAATAEASGAAFVGSGVAAVSAAASYADAQKKSQDEQNFESASKASCGQIRRLDLSKKTVQFLPGEVHLSDAARQRLDEIVRLPADQQEDGVRDFYNQYGSHFFLRYSLGGRYKFTATGKSETTEAKGMLVAAVAATTDWAVSASGSYAGMGGAFSAAAGVRGQTSVAEAKGDRFGLKFGDATVSVATEAIGGAGLVPRDVWAQSLDYNSTWAVIDRDQPRGVWELVASDSTLSTDIKNMSSLLEKVWVRNIFFDAVKKTDPSLYGYLKKNPAVSTCKLLKRAIEELDRDAKELVRAPELNVVVVTATSGSAEHPAASTRPPRQGLKLIGGGAIVDMPLGQPGNLLFESYPERDSWVAGAKSHKWSCQATVKAYGVYLDDPDDLWDVKVVSARTDANSNAPEVTAILPPGYALTGGGAKITWSGGQGLMLKESRPAQIQGQYRGWIAKGTDHIDPDVGTAEAFVIGIRPKNGAEIPPTNVYSVNNKERDKVKSGVYWPTLEQGAQLSEEVIVGGGAATGYEPPPPSLLTGSGLTSDSQKWFAAARTHVPPGNPPIAERQYVELTIWVICRKGRLMPA